MDFVIVVLQMNQEGGKFNFAIVIVQTETDNKRGQN